jgi:hypothetical protein
MIAAAVAIGVLLVTAWLGVMGALALWATTVGVSRPITLLAIVALNLILSAFLYLAIRRKSLSLGFPATLRTLAPMRTRIDEAKAS